MGNILTTQEKTRLSGRQVAFVGGMSLLMSQSIFAAALFEHIVQPYVGTQLTYDSNVLRLPNNPTPAMSGNKATTASFIKQINAGLATQWQISQQQLIMDASVNQNWYSTFTELNYTGYDLLGQWNWQLGQKLKGELSYSKRLTLGSFQSINRLVAKNLENRTSYVARGNYEIFPDWYLRAGFVREDTIYPSTERQQNNLIENSKIFGLRYNNPSPLDNPLDDLLGFYVTLTDGKYPLVNAASIFDNAYTRTSYNIEGRWNYSIKTRIRGEIGYTSQDFQHVKARNFSGIIANGDILWRATRKSSVLLEAWRQIEPAGTLTASFVLNQGVRLTPTWTWTETPKIQVELPISYEQRLALGSTGFSNGTGASAQQAGTSNIRLNLNYTPIQNVEMTAFMSYEDRRSNNNVRLSSYKDEQVGFNVKVSF